MVLLILPYIVLLVLGAKATWKLALNVLAASLDGGIAFAVVAFCVMFLIIGPIMGVVTLVKFIILRVNTPHQKRSADCERSELSSENPPDDKITLKKENVQ